MALGVGELFLVGVSMNTDMLVQIIRSRESLGAGLVRAFKGYHKEKKGSDI
jgi:hypothetical protein